MRKQLNKKIAALVAEFGLSKEKIIKLSDMEKIAKAAECDLFDVMWYLRHER